MRVVILPSADEVGQRAAELIAARIQAPNNSGTDARNCVLGLATGGTPQATYRELVQMYRNGQVDFSHVTSFNLDEYIGLGPADAQSYRTFMQQNLFDHINIDHDRTFVPDGLAHDSNAACQKYEALIRQAGGIDLQLLGIGRDGHIAFNEPGSSLASRTRVKLLAAATINDNRRFFRPDETVPDLAITMGIGTIMEAREILLLAVGSNKAEAVRDMVEGPITALMPASILQMHPKVSVIADSAAAELLQHREYYIASEVAQRQIEGL